MPHNKKRGKPLDLVLGENEVSEELAQQLSEDPNSKIATEQKQNPSNRNNRIRNDKENSIK